MPKSIRTTQLMIELFEMRSALATGVTNPIFYAESYLSNQGYQKPIRFEYKQGNSRLFIILNLEGTHAVSLPRSLFGSFYCENVAHEHLIKFERDVSARLMKMGIDVIQITHPVPIYSSFIREKWLMESGYLVKSTELNQHVELSSSVDLHHMEQRKINRFEDLLVIQSCDDFNLLHQFISACRKQQGLEINITRENLLNLVKSNPQKYEGYLVKLEDKIICVLIFVVVDAENVYYYLPATLEEYKSYSPMVALMNYLYKLLDQRGFKNFDLGISSVNGIKQEGLYEFKAHMGAKTSYRITYQKFLSVSS